MNRLPVDRTVRNLFFQKRGIDTRFALGQYFLAVLKTTSGFGRFEGYVRCLADSDKLENIMGVRFLLLLIVLIAFGLVGWALLAKPEKEVTSAVLAGALAVSAAIVGAGVTHYSAKTREAEEAHRLHKIQVYTEYVDLIVEGFSLVKEAEGLTAEEKIKIQAEGMEKIEVGFLSFSKKLLLWGSPEVLQEFQEFRSFGQDPKNSGNTEILFYGDDVFRAMRSDLGLSNAGLQRGDLIKLFLSDSHNFERLMRN